MRAKIKFILADLFCSIFQLTIPNSWSVFISTRLSALTYEVKVNEKKLKYISNSELLLYRSKTFHDKEPETNNWISKMPGDSVFYDIGANVGIYTLMAAVFCRKVFAFEPVAVNYSILNQNLLNNSLDNIVTAYCIAVSDKSSFDTMRLSSGVVGSAHHTFGADRNANHENFSPAFKQGSFAVALDDLIYNYNFECPNYLKIDVDGNEHLVIGGANKLLSDTKLKSILIEVNKDLKIDQNLVETIKSHGFKLTESGKDDVFNGMKFGNLIFFRH